jgi:signal transduction histidine kinase
LAEKVIEVHRKNNLVYGSFGLATLLALLGVLFYNQQKLKNRQLKKEGELKQALARIETQNKLQEQRLRISRDLHDNIGAQLTFVTSSVDNLKYGLKDADEKVSLRLGTISAFTTQTIYELRDTIWAMNKTEISFEDLQGRISNFIDNAGSAAEHVEFSFQVSEAIDASKTVSSVTGMNMYRIIQEAVNNALKYAKANVIIVRISLNDGDKNVIVIQDNGKGFDVQNAALGNGLINMKKRARDIEGTIEIKSMKDKGTCITLIV